MSKTHRHLSRSIPPPAGTRRRGGPIDLAGPATVNRCYAPVRSIRIDLQTLFDDEPEVSTDGCGDVWRLMGLNPDALCTGADGLVRLTVI
ncbi:MAG: hypothetical protein ABI696_00290 [Rubrivivax sp.]